MVITSAIYYITIFSIFVWGNMLLWREVADSDRRGHNWTEESVYDHRILWVILGAILFLNWVAILLLIHFTAFFVTLYIFWNKIFALIVKVAYDLSPRTLMESLVDIFGQSEMQDSLVIGFL